MSGPRTLPVPPAHPTFGRMPIRAALKAVSSNPEYRGLRLAAGAGMMVLAPLVGLLPGPGGVVVFAAGLGLTLRNSIWAKRRYAMFKKHLPKAGRWADWGLRRNSAKRRAEAAKLGDTTAR